MSDPDSIDFPLSKIEHPHLDEREQTVVSSVIPMEAARL